MSYYKEYEKALIYAAYDLTKLGQTFYNPPHPTGEPSSRDNAIWDAYRGKSRHINVSPANPMAIPSGAWEYPPNANKRVYNTNALPAYMTGDAYTTGNLPEHTPITDGLAASVSELPEDIRTQLRFGSGGRRPHDAAAFPLQDLEGHSLPHDDYGLLSASIRSGNRHAIPYLVHTLKMRDHPLGWHPIWSTLHRELERRIGDLPHDIIAKRLDSIAEGSRAFSTNPEIHNALHEGAKEALSKGDTTGYKVLSDHMEENGLESYAKLLRAEMANIDDSMRKETKKGRRV